MSSNTPVTVHTDTSSLVPVEPPSGPNGVDTGSSSDPNKKQKRHFLNVEAILHPSCPHPPYSLQQEVESYVKRVGQAQSVFKEGPIHFNQNDPCRQQLEKDEYPVASPLIQQSFVEIKIVDMEDGISSGEKAKYDYSSPVEEEHDCCSSSSKLVESSLSSSDTTELTPSFNDKVKSIPSQDVSQIHVFIYVLHSTTAEPEELDMDDGANGEAVIAYEITSLPNSHLSTSWESLIVPTPVKSNLVGYATSALLFSSLDIDCHIISWNRIILLHGPPGTGKTSLCRALAHKLSIRCCNTFPQGGYLLEIKSHSLFSRWFSESGKLISKLFERIQEMVEDEPEALFCVLLDEVESLAANRMGQNDGESGEPSDAVRATNALLTSLDRLKQYKNLIIFTTTNITHGVDSAFVDRVDMKQYIGLPCLEARFQILKSCVDELIRVGIVSSVEVSSRKQVGLKLFNCAEASSGLSGRSIRKIPFQTHAFFLNSRNLVVLSTFLDAMLQCISREKESVQDVKRKPEW